MYSSNIGQKIILDHSIHTYNKLTLQNKNTYEAKINDVVEQMKTKNDILYEVQLKLEKKKEIHRELKELYSMQCEEKTQRMIEKRILHLQQINTIKQDINNEEYIKQNLIDESIIIMDKIKKIIQTPLNLKEKESVLKIK